MSVQWPQTAPSWVPPAVLEPWAHDTSRERQYTLSGICQADGHERTKGGKVRTRGEQGPEWFCGMCAGEGRNWRYGKAHHSRKADGRFWRSPSEDGVPHHPVAHHGRPVSCPLPCSHRTLVSGSLQTQRDTVSAAVPLETLSHSWQVPLSPPQKCCSPPQRPPPSSEAFPDPAWWELEGETVAKRTSAHWKVRCTASQETFQVREFLVRPPHSLGVVGRRSHRQELLGSLLKTWSWRRGIRVTGSPPGGSSNEDVPDNIRAAMVLTNFSRERSLT